MLCRPTRRTRQNCRRGTNRHIRRCPIREAVRHDHLVNGYVLLVQARRRKGSRPHQYETGECRKANPGNKQNGHAKNRSSQRAPSSLAVPKTAVCGKVGVRNNSSSQCRHRTQHAARLCREVTNWHIAAGYTRCTSPLARRSPGPFITRVSRSNSARACRRDESPIRTRFSLCHIQDGCLPAIKQTVQLRDSRTQMRFLPLNRPCSSGQTQATRRQQI